MALSLTLDSTACEEQQLAGWYWLELIEWIPGAHHLQGTLATPTPIVVELRPLHSDVASTAASFSIIVTRIATALLISSTLNPTISWPSSRHLADYSSCARYRSVFSQFPRLPIHFPHSKPDDALVAGELNHHHSIRSYPSPYFIALAEPAADCSLQSSDSDWTANHCTLPRRLVGNRRLDVSSHARQPTPHNFKDCYGINFTMAHQGMGGFGSSMGGGSIDPNDLNMGGGFGQSFAGNGSYHDLRHNSGIVSNPRAGGSLINDEDLLDGLNEGNNNHAMGGNQDFAGMNMGFSHDYQDYRHNSGLRLDPSQVKGYSSTPDGDPVPSPYTAGFNQANFRQQMQNMHSPMTYSADPNGGDQNYLNARARASMSQQMQRKPSNNARSPMTPKTNAMHGMSLGSNDSPNFGPQSIRTVGSHEKSPSAQWLNTPNGSYPASYNSGFASPLQGTMVQPLEEVMGKGGASMPAKLGMNQANNQPVSSQEAKRKRRRESHNLVERRRRDNINERIQDLSKLVPAHRLDDDKIRKLIQNGTPLSPSLTGISNPSSATSGLAGPGARRATSTTAGNITTGLPVDDKDKGPNKGDILNGAVSWTRDLMWMLHLKLQQQEDIMNHLNEIGQPFPFETTDDERRMQSELLEAMARNDVSNLTYTRTSGTGLRVPNFTDYRGSSTSGAPPADLDSVGITPPPNGDSAIVDDMNDTDQFWHVDNNGFKDEDEYGMDLN